MDGDRGATAGAARGSGALVSAGAVRALRDGLGHLASVSVADGAGGLTGHGTQTALSRG
jgi:hypothetical protein